MISVIVPIFNAEDTLSKCLDSILNQTFMDFEIICINDGSNDKSLEILKKYKERDNRIVIIDQENKGISAARNIGIKIARGEYVTFIDSDDWIEPDTFMKVNEQIIKNYNVIRIEYQINDTKREKNIYDEDIIFNSKQISNEIIPKVLKGIIPAYSCLLYIKRKTLMEKKWYFNEETYYMEDIEFFLKICYSCENIYFKKDILYHYFFNIKSHTKAKKNIKKNIYGILNIHKKVIQILKEKDNLFEERRCISDTIYANDILNYAYLCYYNKDIQIFSTIKEIINSEQFKEMSKNFNYKLIPIHLRIQLMLAKHKKILLIKLYWKMRKTIGDTFK